jgi:hypothetical protein
MECFNLCPDLRAVAFEAHSRLSQIEAAAFRSTRLATICLPASLEALGDSCFESRRIRSVFFEPGCKVASIGAAAFRACALLRSIRIPSSVEELGPECFDACSRLTFVTFESSSKISCIRYGTFAQCAALSSVEFGEGSMISSIERMAFAICRSLKFLCFPASLAQFSAGALFGTSLENVWVEPGNRSFKATGSFVTSLDGAFAMLYYGSESELIIPSSVVDLVPAFQNATSLSVVSFERGSRIRSFPELCFANCEPLSSICIPASVTTLGRECFSGCLNLATVLFEPGSNLSRIDEGAFAGCVSLSSICVPASVGGIPPHCFRSCEQLSAVTFESDSNLERIGESAFAFCQSLPAIYIPSSVRAIGASAFKRCAKLANVTFPPDSKLSDLAHNAFRRCNALKVKPTCPETPDKAKQKRSHGELPLKPPPHPRS